MIQMNKLKDSTVPDYRLQEKTGNRMIRSAAKSFSALTGAPLSHYSWLKARVCLVPLHASTSSDSKEAGAYYDSDETAKLEGESPENEGGEKNPMRFQSKGVHFKQGSGSSRGRGGVKSSRGSEGSSGRSGRNAKVGRSGRATLALNALKYRSILHNSAKSQDFKSAWKALERLEDACTPSQLDYNVILNLIGNTDNGGDARRPRELVELIFARMETKQVVPDSFTFGAAIKACRKDIVKAMKLIQLAFERLGFNPILHSMALKSLAEAGLPWEVSQPNHTTVAGEVANLPPASLKEAILQLGAIISQGSDTSGALELNKGYSGLLSVLNKLERRRDVISAYEFVCKEISGEFEFDPVACSCVAAAYSSLGYFEGALTAARRAVIGINSILDKSNYDGPAYQREFAYESAIRGFGTHKYWEEAVKMLRSMEEDGVTPGE